MPSYYDKFEAGKFFHVYNRAVGNENLFFSDSNFYYFLNQYQKILSPFLETYAYCLIPNHFHFLIRVLDVYENDELVSEAFRKFSISFAQTVNFQQNRKGSLFMRPLKKKLINDDSYLTRIMLYIHQNPSNHGLVKDFSRYKWSSYNSILSNLPTSLQREEVLEWFGGEKEFILAHQQEQDTRILSDFLFE